MSSSNWTRSKTQTLWRLIQTKLKILYRYAPQSEPFREVLKEQLERANKIPKLSARGRGRGGGRGRGRGGSRGGGRGGGSGNGGGEAGVASWSFFFTFACLPVFFDVSACFFVWSWSNPEDQSNKFTFMKNFSVYWHLLVVYLLESSFQTVNLLQNVRLNFTNSMDLFLSSVDNNMWYGFLNLMRLNSICSVDIFSILFYRVSQCNNGFYSAPRIPSIIIFFSKSPMITKQNSARNKVTFSCG